MKSTELVDSVMERLNQLDARVRAAFEGMDDTRANQPIPPSNWSSFQILDHLVKANQPYIDALPAAIGAAPENGDAPATFSWFGKFIIKAAGPVGNAPTPKVMLPDAGPMSRAKLDDYLAQTSEILALVEKARGKDLGSTRMNNPFVKILKLTLADAFEILATHAERHIGQIESALQNGR